MSNSTFHRRRNLRLKGYDYSMAGAYFVTICTQDRACLFGDVVDGAMHLNEAGEMVAALWGGIAARLSCVEIDLPEEATTVVFNGDDSISSGPERGDHKGRPYNGYADCSGAPRGRSPQPRPAGRCCRRIQVAGHSRLCQRCQGQGLAGISRAALATQLL